MKPLPLATIRLYEVRCNRDNHDDCFGPNRTPPQLRAETQSDADGNFVAVVSRP